MYDLEIVMPVSVSDAKYKTRLMDFKKHGLVNIRDHKIILKLLFGPQFEKKEWEEGWSDGINLQIFTFDDDSPSCKIYTYYSTLTEKDLDSAKWFMRIDDDTMTDISLLMQNIEANFDYKKEHYIVGALQDDVDVVEYELLSALGFGNWYNKKVGVFVKSPVHEFQMAVISQTVMKIVLSNPQAKKLLKMRSVISDGWGDHCFALAAKICKIYPALASDFISCHCDFSKFSFVGGPLAHIHEISADNEWSGDFLSYFNILQKDSNDTPEGKMLKKWSVNIPKLGLRFLKFTDNYTIINAESEIIGFWGVSIKNKPMLLLDYNSKWTLFIFNKDVSGTYFCKIGGESIQLVALTDMGSIKTPCRVF